MAENQTTTFIVFADRLSKQKAFNLRLLIFFNLVFGLTFLHTKPSWSVSELDTDILSEIEIDQQVNQELDSDTMILNQEYLPQESEKIENDEGFNEWNIPVNDLLNSFDQGWQEMHNQKQVNEVKTKQNNPLTAPDRESDLDSDLDSDSDSDSDLKKIGDPELGNLILEEIKKPPIKTPPVVYLLGRFYYLHSDNVFSGIDPIDDQLFSTGITLLAAPKIAPQTYLFATAGGNLIRYNEQSDFDYNQLNFGVGVRQIFSAKNYADIGWLNRQLSNRESGDRFLNDHSLYLKFNHQEILAKNLNLDSFYQLRFSFADPENRTQTINSIGTSLSYQIKPVLQAALDYQYTIATFTGQDRQDEYHQLIASLQYKLSPKSKLEVFGGYSFGGSSEENINFDGLILGIGFSFNLDLL